MVLLQMIKGQTLPDYIIHYSDLAAFVTGNESRKLPRGLRLTSVFMHPKDSW